MRAVWVVTVILVAVGLVAWGTTCTGQRPIPTGDTIPGGAVATTSTAVATTTTAVAITTTAVATTTTAVAITTTAVADPGTEVLAG